ncbi:MAG: translation initiation factor IF-3 [Puniceicoccales bacterium]|jgi:translation initiation factor IF-3|nr:translation initiation factor IF-3 [Puniceicoccales bacterium]
MTNFTPQRSFKKPEDSGRRFVRGRVDRGPRCDERIRVPEVRVIGPAGEQLGVMDTREALALAKSHGLNLVEVAAMSMPPVCKIVDYGKHRYLEAKKTKGHVKPNAAKYKELKFRPNVDVGDYSTKIRQGVEFLQKGMKLKLTLMFRGREMAHQEIGHEVVLRAIDDLQQFGVLETPPKLSGRIITATLSPRAARLAGPTAL